MNIVALHGWGHEKDSFNELKKQLESLPQVKTVYAFDLPGFGNQKLVDNKWDIPHYADWVQAQIKRLKLKDVILIGHSFGGRIAAHIASQNPDYLEGLVLSGAPVLYRPTLKVTMKRKLFSTLKDIIPTKAKSFIFSKELKDAESRGLGAIFRKVVLFDQTKSLPKIAVPTLLIWGEYDTDVPLRIAKETHKLIPHSKLVIIKAASHTSFLIHPYIFFGYVKKFIESL